MLTPSEKAIESNTVRLPLKLGNFAGCWLRFSGGCESLPDFRIENYEGAPTAKNPLGVKGAGEAGSGGAPPAVVNAVVDALKEYGVRHIDMPLTPLRVWRALSERPRAG